MINVNTDSVLDAANQLFIKLFNAGSAHSDEEIFKEDAACIVIENFNLNSSAFLIKEGTMYYNYDLNEISPLLDNNLGYLEAKHWQDVILSTSSFKNMDKYLSDNPTTKRAIIEIWDDSYRDLNNSSVCVVYIYFRINFDSLEMHVHSRALNAFSLAFLDFQAMITIGKYMAEKINKKFDRYIHYVDSLHIYKKDYEKSLNYYNSIK